MSQENQITLRGYLTAEPKFFQKSPQATPLTEIRVGCTPRRLNRESGEWQEMPTSYFKVKCWRRLAINTASSLHKGDQVVIRGHFYMSNWVDSQQRPRSTLEIEADTIGHDLAYGWSHFLRGTRSPGNKEGVNSGEMARQDTGTQGTQGLAAQGLASWTADMPVACRLPETSKVPALAQHPSVTLGEAINATRFMRARNSQVARHFIAALMNRHSSP